MGPRKKPVLKRQRQERVRHEKNRHYKSQMKTAVKKVLSAAQKDEALKFYTEAVSLIDRLVTKGIIHKNTAARRKSAISRHLNSLH